MAVIKKYNAQELITSPSMPQTRVANPMGQAIAGLGGTITDVADHFQQQQEKKEDFKVENDYRTLQLKLGQEAETTYENTPEDGSNYSKNFMTSVYQPARDQFLANVPERLKERYGTILGDEGADTVGWSVKTATRERDKLYGWYENQLKVGQEELQTAISMDPDGYDKVLQQGLDTIDASGLPPSKKAEQKQAWTKMAQVSHLNKMLETKPEQVLKDLGADPRMLSPTTQFGILKQSLMTTENAAGDPSAVSSKGAVGLMQVMPGTARDISKWMSDGLIDKSMSDARVAELLTNPAMNERYGDYYLKKMIKDYSGKGGVEAALVGYNAGPGVAQKWIESGFDNSVLPAETRNYVKKTMGRLPATFGSPSSEFSSADKGDPAKVQFTFARSRGASPLKGQDEEHLNQDLTSRVRTAFAGIGINNVKVNSGFRDAADNARVGGAKGSQHKHGNAMDIDVSGYSLPERVKIIQALSASGVTGLGIGSNIIHADVGGRRAWGYAKSDGGGAIPKWAQAAITEHLSNTAKAPIATAIGGRYAGLPYAERQQYIHAADQQLTQQTMQAQKATALQKVELQTAMRNELASLQTSGKSTDLIDDTAVSTVLGEDDYFKWVGDRERARKTYTARDGIAEMSLQEMDDRLREYTPDEGSATFADDQKVQSAVQKEIDRVTRLRANNPTEAAMLYKDVKSQWDAINETEQPAPEAVQEFVRINLERQKEFGIKPGSEEPVPRAWAVQIGQQLSKVPELQGKNKNDVNASIIVMYDGLQKVFGDYTDEVIISALKEYKGVGTNTAELLTGYMQAIQGGGDPLARLRNQKDRALDQDQVEGATSGGFWSGLSEFWNGKPEVEKAAEAIDGQGNGAVNSDQLLRAQSTIRNLGEDMTPEQEASLVRRYGQATVDAAKASIGTEE